MSKNRRKPRSISVSDDLWEQVEHEAAATGLPISGVVVHALTRYFQSQTIRSSDWDTDDSDAWYDENKYYTFSQDKFGHSARIEVTIPKMVAGEIAGIIESGKIPELRNAQDFYRNAVRHQAYRTAKALRDGALVDVAHQMTILDRIATQQAASTEYAEMEAKLRQLLDEELILGHYEFVKEELKAYWASASAVGERFREKYIACLREYQARLIQAQEIDATKGTKITSDGRRYKNGIELTPARDIRD